MVSVFFFFLIVIIAACCEGAKRGRLLLLISVCHYDKSLFAVCGSYSSFFL